MNFVPASPVVCHPARSLLTSSFSLNTTRLKLTRQITSACYFSALDQVRRRRPCRFLSTGRRLNARRLHWVEPPPSLSATGKTARRQANPPPTADRNSIEFFDEIHRPLARSVTRRAPGPSKDDRPS